MYLPIFIQNVQTRPFSFGGNKKKAYLCTIFTTEKELGDLASAERPRTHFFIHTFCYVCDVKTAGKGKHMSSRQEATMEIPNTSGPTHGSIVTWRVDTRRVT